MMLAGFVDELTKLGAAGSFQLGDLVLGRRAPLNSIGVLVRRALIKRANDLSTLHNEIAPTAIEVNPTDATTRLPDAVKTISLIRPGALGAVTPSADPIDRERHNRAWNSPPR
jgi:hypothetical protein